MTVEAMFFSNEVVKGRKDCTSVLCRRVGRVCVGLHCPRCDEPVGDEGHTCSDNPKPAVRVIPRHRPTGGLVTDSELLAGVAVIQELAGDPANLQIGMNQQRLVAEILSAASRARQ